MIGAEGGFGVSHFAGFAPTKMKKIALETSRAITYIRKTFERFF